MADHPPSGGLSGLDKLAQQEIYSHMRFYTSCQTGEGEDSLIVIWWAAMMMMTLLLSILFFLTLQCLCEEGRVWKMQVLNFVRFQNQFLKYCSFGPSWHLLCSSFHRIQPAKTARTHYPDCVHDRWFLKGLLAKQQNGKICKIVLWLASTLAKCPVYAQG